MHADEHVRIRTEHTTARTHSHAHTHTHTHTHTHKYTRIHTHAVKIVTGSLQGMLRVYQPNGRQFKPDDLLLEQELDQAILQIEAGRFSS